jgi:hypothetical protein
VNKGFVSQEFIMKKELYLEHKYSITNKLQSIEQLKLKGVNQDDESIIGLRTLIANVSIY